MISNRITPYNITSLKTNEIFVFGSNTEGRHWLGAALFALKKCGAKLGQSFGLQGQSFAIPTKQLNNPTLPAKLPLSTIQKYVTVLIEWSIIEKDKIFLVTEIGCGLAGYTPSEIAPLFKEAIDVENIHLPERFWNILE